MAKAEKVWVVVGKDGEAYVDFRYTRKDMKQHHCDTLGYMSWKEASAKGDRCVQATLKLEMKRKRKYKP